MKRISILIPIYNRLIVTKQGLISLNKVLDFYYNQQKINCSFEIVIIDDGSKDGSAGWISANYPEIHILKGDGTLWWSGAINLGAKFSIENLKVDYLLLWNDDIVPRDDYFIQLEHIINNNDLENQIIGSAIFFYTNPNKILCTGGFFNKFSGKMSTCLKSVGDVHDIIECDWLWGMGTVISTSLINDKNIWWDNKNFPQYYGDTDFTLRFKKKGVKILTNLNLVIYNKVEHSGITKVKTFTELFEALTSKRSFFNIYRNFLFNSLHGIPPFSYYGMVHKYLFYLGGFIKHRLKREYD